MPSTTDRHWAWAATEADPALRRGRVRCVNPRCRTERTVSSALCLQNGWPQHCGETMELVTDGD